MRLRKLMLIVLLLVLAVAPASFAEEVPRGAVFSADGRVSGALFLPDGRVVYVPVKMEGESYLPDDEVRCVDRHGTLLWSCAIPQGKMSWGGPHSMSDGRFGLVSRRENGANYLEIISEKGEYLHAQALPDGLIPLLVAGDTVYGTLQEETYTMFAISTEGQAKPVAFDGIDQNAAAMWAWPKDEGHILMIVGRLSREEDFTKRTGAQWLIYLDALGKATERKASLTNRNYVNGFQFDAALNDVGGLTALSSGRTGENALNIFSIHTYAPKAKPVTDWIYALKALTVRPLLIDRRAEGSYTVWGSGKMTEMDSSGFVFRMDVDESGQVLAVSGRKAEGCSMARYLNGEPYVYSPWGPKWWVAPFDALPDLPLQAERISAVGHDR